jgi:hypothetical protein
MDGTACHPTCAAINAKYAVSLPTASVGIRRADPDLLHIRSRLAARCGASS